jgi:hypothetical protein
MPQYAFDSDVIIPFSFVLTAGRYKVRPGHKKEALTPVNRKTIRILDCV